MRTVLATRYVTPLREGGSLPGIVEGDDDGLYVAKFHGAGQGPKALVAEVVAGELARAGGLRVPELVRLEVDAALGRNEPDAEVRALLRASVGANAGVDFLPGSLCFDPAAGPAPGAAEASEIVWFDAFVANVDREARNPNLLVWHGNLWLIDHGAALYFHHRWASADPEAAFPAIRAHVLLPWAASLPAAAARLAPVLDAALEPALAAVPDAWLLADPAFPTAAAHRAAYLRHLRARLAGAARIAEEAERARAALV
jgi:hypothetical protein